MQLTDPDIREFQALWQEEFGEAISADRARHEIALLLELYSLLARAARSRS